jgi:hypothetical protein
MTEFSDWVEARLAEQKDRHASPRQLETGQRLLAALEIWRAEMSVHTSHHAREQALHEQERMAIHVITILSGAFLVGIIAGALGITSDIPGPEAAVGLAFILFLAGGSRWDYKRRLRDADERDKWLNQRIAQVRIDMGPPRH